MPFHSVCPKSSEGLREKLRVLRLAPSAEAKRVMRTLLTYKSSLCRVWPAVLIFEVYMESVAHFKCDELASSVSMFPQKFLGILIGKHGKYIKNLLFETDLTLFL